MTKIIHIAAHLGAGVGKAISGMISGLNDYSNDILLLEAPESFKYYDKCKEKNIEIYVSSDYDYIKNLLEKYDAVVLNWWGHPLSFNVLRALSTVNSRLILWSHVNGLRYPYLTENFLEHFDQILFTSPCSFENPELDQNKFGKSASVVYGMGEFEPELCCCKKDYSVSSKLRIGYSGTLNYSKINENFSEICGCILSKNENTEILLYGKYEKEFEDDLKLKNRKYKDRIIFKGFSENLEKELPDLDIYFYPLTPDNYATTENALIEAMAAALPVVVLNNPAERNIVKNNDTGFAADSVKDFCDTINALSSDEERRKKAGISARKYVIENYSYDKNVSEFVSALRKVLKKAKSLHDFSETTGNDPFDFFCSLCHTDMKYFNGDKINSNYPKIYTVKSKGSPFHFLKYYSDNNRFIDLTNRIAKDISEEEK